MLPRRILISQITEDPEPLSTAQYGKRLVALPFDLPSGRCFIILAKIEGEDNHEIAIIGYAHGLLLGVFCPAAEISICSRRIENLELDCVRIIFHNELFFMARLEGSGFKVGYQFADFARVCVPWNENKAVTVNLSVISISAAELTAIDVDEGRETRIGCAATLQLLPDEV